MPSPAPPLAAVPLLLLAIGREHLTDWPSKPEYEELQAQKEVLYADYGKLKKQVAEYDVIKRNIDSILHQERGTEKGKDIMR